MSGMSSLSIATSGLRTAQAGLYVVGHNMSNSGTEGFVRQRVLQHDFLYNNIGYNSNGILQLGLGADITQIQQIRDTFIDITYRQEVSKGNFYAVKSMTGLEIETILGELQSAYNAQSVIHDMWNALNELSVYQPGLETRANFISTAVTFIDKVNNVADRLLKYQRNLDDQIRDGVTRVNQLLEKIAVYNVRIMDAEMSGDHANDFRDTRNLCLDELSQYLDIEYKEMPNGRVDIICNGRDLLVNNDINRLSLKYTSGDYSFVEPVFTGGRTDAILPYDASPNSYYTLFDLTGPVTSERGNDKGILKGLLVARGYYPANYATEPVEPQKPATVDKPDVMSTLAAMPDPTSGIYSHILPDADVEAFLLDYQNYLADYKKYQNDQRNHALYPEKYPAPAMPAPQAPALPGNTVGFDPAFLADYATYAGSGGTYDTYMVQYGTYAAGYAAQQVPYAQYKKDLAQYDIDYLQYQKDVFNITYATIPKVQRELDTLVNKIITLINNALSPVIEDPLNPGKYIRDYADAPVGENGAQFDEVFVRKYPPYSARFDENGFYIPEDPNNPYSLYTIGNVIINPALLNTDGYNNLAFSLGDGVEDTRLVLDLMEKWKSAFISFDGKEPLSVDDAYKQLVNGIATETREATRFSQEQTVLVTQIENKRQSLSGVSLDEEMTNMLKYQHAYNASARMVTVLDGMIDVVVNRLGRAGR